MDEGLLSEILTVEQDIRRQIAQLHDELAASRAGLERQLEEREQQQRARLEAECAARRAQADTATRLEAEGVIAAGLAYAARLDAVADAELDSIVLRYLDILRPERNHDRPDE